MGHNRLGRLPKTLRWREVVGLLDDEQVAATTVATAVLRAADHRFRRLVHDPTLGYCLWLLARITWEARGEMNTRRKQLWIKPWPEFAGLFAHRRAWCGLGTPDRTRTCASSSGGWRSIH